MEDPGKAFSQQNPCFKSSASSAALVLGVNDFLSWLCRLLPKNYSNMSPEKGPFKRELHLPTILFPGTCECSGGIPKSLQSGVLQLVFGVWPFWLG